MSEAYPKIEGVIPGRPAPPPVERRQSARTLLRDVTGTLSWSGEDGEVVRDVAVLNVSGGGAALFADEAPPAGQLIRLVLRCDSSRMDPVAGHVVDARPDPSGRWVIHVRFAHWVSLIPLLERYREHRLWERYPARQMRASLSWLEGMTERIARGELLNISGGGAAFVSEMAPPHGIPLFLRLEAEGVRAHAVEARLVTTSVDPSGMRIAHLQFIDPCPMDLFELAVGGPG